MHLFKNRKGQALIESTVVIHIMLIIFFAMIMFGVYLYDRAVVVFAAHSALDEGIGKIAVKNMTGNQLKTLMQQRAAGAMSFALLIKQPVGVSCGAQIPQNGGKGRLWAGVEAELDVDFPFVGELLKDNKITHYVSTDYYFSN